MASLVGQKPNFAFEDLSNTFADEGSIKWFGYIPASRSSRETFRYDASGEVSEKIEKAVSMSLYSPVGCDIPCSEAGKFFQVIHQLQAEGSIGPVPIQCVQKTIRDLTEHRHLTPAAAAELQNQVLCGREFKAYTDEVEETQNLDKALSLACHFREQAPHYHDSALEWLSKAKVYAKEKKLGDIIDLDAFFSAYTCIGAEIFRSAAVDDELIQVAARTPQIVKVAINPFEKFRPDWTVYFAKFLELTKSVREVKSGGTWTTRQECALTYEGVIPIAKALQTNTSITELYLWDTEIGDEGVVCVVDAILSNPASVIKKLNFFCCRMSDIGASKVLELVKTRKHITSVDIRKNGSVSEVLEKELERILQERCE